MAELEDWEQLLALQFINDSQARDNEAKEIMQVVMNNDSSVWIKYAHKFSKAQPEFYVLKALVIQTFKHKVKNAKITETNKKTLLWLVDLYGGILPDDVQLSRMPFKFKFVPREVQVELLKHHLDLMTSTFKRTPSFVRSGMLVLMSSAEAFGILQDKEPGSFILRMSNQSPSSFAVTAKRENGDVTNWILNPDEKVEFESRVLAGVTFKLYHWDEKSLKRCLEEHPELWRHNPISYLQVHEHTSTYREHVLTEYKDVKQKMREAYSIDSDPEEDKAHDEKIPIHYFVHEALDADELPHK